MRRYILYLLYLILIGIALFWFFQFFGVQKDSAQKKEPATQLSEDSAFSAQSLLLEPILVWTNLYDTLLAKHVIPGKKKGIQANLVDYEKLKDDPLFKIVVRKLGTLPSLSTLPLSHQLAMWLNAYHVLILKIICDSREWDSEEEKVGLPLSWQEKKIVVAGQRYTLKVIEHGILRKQFRDPRIHFALFSGTLSCPDLATQAYRGELMDAQLENSMRSFLINPTKGILITSSEIKVSFIFQWYRADFRSTPLVWLVREGFIPSTHPFPYKIQFLDYNWSLNSLSNAQESLP